MPRAGIEPARPFRAKGFSYHYGFRHRSRLPRVVCGPDYSFTMELGSLGVSCLVSAPSSFRRLGSRLPSALPVMVSLNLRHSTSLFSESALKLCLSPSCLPFHHQGKWVGSAKIRFFLKYSVLRGKNRWGLRRSQSGVYEKSIRKIILLILRK